MRTNEKPQVKHKHNRFNGTVCTALMFSFIVGGAIAKAEPYDLEFCSFLGGNKWERVQSVFVDADGFIYAAGSTKSTNFPTTSGAYDMAGSNNNSNDGGPPTCMALTVTTSMESTSMPTDTSLPSAGPGHRIFRPHLARMTAHIMVTWMSLSPSSNQTVPL